MLRGTMLPSRAKAAIWLEDLKQSCLIHKTRDR
jgi:hypothetical protein